METCVSVVFVFLVRLSAHVFRSLISGGKFMNSCNIHGKGLCAEKVNLAQTMPYQKAKERICIRTVNHCHNRQELEKLPYIGWEDLAIVFCYDVEDGGEIPILPEDLQQWGIDLYELHRNALIQSRRIHPPLFASLREVLGLPEDCEDAGAESSLYVLTCRKAFYGSSVMFYPGMMTYLAERLGGDLYVIPSSVHEVLLIRKEEIEDPQGLVSIIRSINRQELLPGDILSDSLYEYLADRDLLRRLAWNG